MNQSPDPDLTNIPPDVRNNEGNPVVSSRVGQTRETDDMSLETYFAEKTGKPEVNDGKEPSKSLGRRIFSFLATLAICLVLLLLLTQFVVQRNTVVGSSMVPTLQNKDEVFVEKISRLFTTGLKRGDIVTADSDKTHEVGDEIVIIIKRVIGLPGERVTILEGYVYIDGERLEEPYLADDVLTADHSIKHSDVRLGDDEYYLLGDNRPNSRDSRDIGPVARSEIEGKLLVRFYPFNKIGKPK